MALGGLQAGDDDGDDDGNPPPTDYTGGDCPSNGCGSNGVWLGSEVPFRTLHLSRYRHNEQNLSILGFRAPDSTSLKLGVDGDVVLANDLPVAANSKLLLGPPETPGGPSNEATYELTITNVHDEAFWTDCPTCNRKAFPVYEFAARSLTDDCPVQVCAPDLTDGQNTNNLIGKAVIFRGDYYGDDYTVKITPPSNYDDDLFNIACVGTDISKLHRFRHTSASRGDATTPPPPPVDRRQALLRLLAADYCGSGYPFTHNGVGLKLAFDSASGFGDADNPDPGVIVTPSSLFAVDPNAGLEALWNGDGAVCIGAPRLSADVPDLWKRIAARCRLVNHAVTHCPTAPDPQVPLTAPFPLGGYAISQHP